jgi:DNA-binding transcriptional MerR regulator
MRIGELARKTGLSVDTLRFYERIGLLPRIARDGAGQRQYGPDVLDWIAFLGRLKTMGMPLRQMRHYAELRAMGVATAPARAALLQAHRVAVRAHIAALQESLVMLDAKIDAYGTVNEQETSDD